MSEPSDPKDAFVGKVLSEILNAVSELQVRSDVLLQEVARLRAAADDVSQEEALDGLEQEIQATFDGQLEEITKQFSASKLDRS